MYYYAVDFYFNSNIFQVAKFMLGIKKLDVILFYTRLEHSLAFQNLVNSLVYKVQKFACDTLSRPGMFKVSKRKRNSQVGVRKGNVR